jgi:glycosyltransferase involved in cell wall biosynthesis
VTFAAANGVFTTSRLNRQILKDIVGRTPALQWGWASGMTLRAQFLLARGRSYDAARILLKLEKHLGGAGLASVRRPLLNRIITDHCRLAGALGPLSNNSLLRLFAASAEANTIRRRYREYGPEHQVRLRMPRDNDNPERQGDLIILKHFNPHTKERGVVLVKYNNAILALAAVFDLAALVQEYVVVLEPSNWGYQEAHFLLYQGSDASVLVECARTEDVRYIQSLDSNLFPVQIGDGEWVDPDLFAPRRRGDASFDVVMVGAWDPLKRHEVLFRALAQLKRQGRRLTAALIGYPLSWSRRHIEALTRRYGVDRDCTIFERIPHQDVARIVAESGVAVLLSLQEGSNRSVYECLFADTPVIVHRHHRGINLNDIEDVVGVLCTDSELPAALLRVLDQRDRFAPRRISLQKFGYRNATRRLNQSLAGLEVRSGRPWTTHIVAKKSAPNVMYADAGRHEDFVAEYHRLARWLRPVDLLTS